MILALAATPAPTATPPQELKTIVTVKSTPFCHSIGEHFNAAAKPMFANDRVLDRVGGELTDFNDVFHHPDYQIRYSDIRVKLVKQVAEISKSLPFIQDQINELRNGEKLTSDKGEATQLHQVAEKLQLAYNKQHQLAIDLSGVVQTMMSYTPPNDLDTFHEEMAESAMPAEARNIKSYLRFDGQRDVLAQAEDAAQDQAIALAEQRCTVKK